MTKLEQLQALRAQQQRRGVIPRRVDPRDAEIAQLKTRVAELEGALASRDAMADDGSRDALAKRRKADAARSRAARKRRAQK